MDRIFASRAVNRSAALVTGPGTHWEPGRKILSPGQFHQDIPPPLRPYPRIAPFRPGFRVGRFTVIGYVGQNSKGKGQWAVRCSCGTYEVRLSAGLLRPGAAARAMCARCDYLEELKAGRVPAPPIQSARSARTPG